MSLKTFYRTAITSMLVALPAFSAPVQKLMRADIAEYKAKLKALP